MIYFNINHAIFFSNYIGRIGICKGTVMSQPELTIECLVKGVAGPGSTNANNLSFFPT